MITDGSVWAQSKALALVQSAAPMVDLAFSASADPLYPWVWLDKPGDHVLVWISDTLPDAVTVELVYVTPGQANDPNRKYSVTVCETNAVFAATGAQVIATAMKVLATLAPAQIQ